jgi:hypothetical protein
MIYVGPTKLIDSYFFVQSNRGNLLYDHKNNITKFNKSFSHIIQKILSTNYDTSNLSLQNVKEILKLWNT